MSYRKEVGSYGKIAGMAIPLEPSFEEFCFGSSVPSELVVALEANDFFYGVSQSLVEECAAAFHLAWLPPGMLLYGRKSVSTRMFLILDGAVRLEYASVAKPATGDTLYNGQFTGEPWLILGPQPLHRFAATCVEPTLLCWARGVELTALLDREPQIVLNVARSLHARLAFAMEAVDEV